MNENKLTENGDHETKKVKDKIEFFEELQRDDKAKVQKKGEGCI